MMAERSKRNVVGLERVRGGRIPPLRERRAAKALDLLCDAVSSPAAKSNGLSNDEIVNAIKKLKRCSFDEPEYPDQCTPVWNISSKQELEQVGLDLTEIEGLASILPFRKSSNKNNVSNQLIPEILFTLAILDYDEDKFRLFLSRLDRYLAVGVLLCEILTDTKLLEKAQNFLDRESTAPKREILLEYLKGKLRNLKNLNIAHFASACGQYIAAIVPKEINRVEMQSNKASESDATALATVISHSSVVKELELSDSGLNSKSISSLQDGLKNSDVKICSLHISWNRDIDEEGFCCLGNIVKKHAVEELKMSHCGLSFGKLKSFNKTSGNAKIRSLNILNNRGIDEEGFRCLGNIVKKHAVEELNMSKCGLSFGKLKPFDETLGNAKIKDLNISGNDGLTVNAICQLTLKVTESLIAKRSGVWTERDIRELQDFIHARHRGGLKVTLDDDLPVLRSELTSEEYLSKSAVMDYLPKRQSLLTTSEAKTSSKMSENLDFDEDKSYNAASLESKSKRMRFEEDLRVDGDSRSVFEVGLPQKFAPEDTKGEPKRKLCSPKPSHRKISLQSPQEPSLVLNGNEGGDQSHSSNGPSVPEKVPLSDRVVMFSNMTLCQQGNVYEGTMASESGPRPCAIKFARQPEQNLREEKVLGQLGSHCHVISLLDSGTFDDGFSSQHYLVLEKCHKLNLCQYLSSCKESVPVYDVNWRMNVCKQLLNGVEYIHNKLIIHKDLKPSNVLLSYNDLSMIKIADFGSSQEVDSATSAIYCPYMFGTMGFRPPESFGGSYSSLKSDIFSLGVVLYYLLSNGKSPFGQEMELWDHNIQNGIIQFDQLPLPNPKSTEHLLQCMLSFNRLHRPSIQEVKDHPCWTGTDHLYEFGYFCEEDLHGEIPMEEKVVVDEEVLENERKLIAAWDSYVPRKVTESSIGNGATEDRTNDAKSDRAAAIQNVNKAHMDNGNQDSTIKLRSIGQSTSKSDLERSKTSRPDTSEMKPRTGLLSRLSRWLSSPRMFQLTLICFDKWFVTALHLNHKILSQAFLRGFANDKRKVIHLGSMPLRKGDKVKISLECASPTSGFDFIPSEPFSPIIDDSMLNGNIRYESFHLASDCKAQHIVIICKVWNEGEELQNHAISYYWNPDSDKSKGEPKDTRTPTVLRGHTAVFNGPVTMHGDAKVGSGLHIKGISVGTYVSGAYTIALPQGDNASAMMEDKKKDGKLNLYAS